MGWVNAAVPGTALVFQVGRSLCQSVVRWFVFLFVRSFVGSFARSVGRSVGFVMFSHVLSSFVRVCQVFNNVAANLSQCSEAVKTPSLNLPES